MDTLRYKLRFIRMVAALLFHWLSKPRYIKRFLIMWYRGDIKIRLAWRALMVAVHIKLSDRNDGRGTVIQKYERMIDAAIEAIVCMWREMSGEERVLLHRRFSEMSHDQPIIFVDDPRLPIAIRQRFEEVFTAYYPDGLQSARLLTAFVADLYLCNYEQLSAMPKDCRPN